MKELFSQYIRRVSLLKLIVKNFLAVKLMDFLEVSGEPKQILNRITEPWHSPGWNRP